jgi:chromosome segregation ATPase
MNTINPNLPKAAPQDQGLVPESVKLVFIFILLLLVVYLFYDKSQTNKAMKAEIDRLTTRITSLETMNKVTEASLSSKVSDLKSDLESAVGSTQAELKKKTAQIQAEGVKTKEELAQAISTKADSNRVEEQVRAAKADTESKIGQVSTEVGGVKNEVGTVKSDLANTRRDLEGTQRQLVDVRDTLNAAVAKNAGELAQLRLKGEREYFEFTLPDKKTPVKVEDIRLWLTKTDTKNNRFSLKILVDDKELEKKDRLINEPVQYLVGQNHVRYEVVINWVSKNQVGGYMSIPKDKSLSAERPKK